MTAHLLPRRRRWGRERRMWSMVQEGKVARSRTDYLLGTDISLFSNVSVRDPQHNNDHFMVVGCLRSAPERKHTRYIVGRRKSPLRPPIEPTREDRIFAALRRAVPKPHGRNRHKNEWISEETWRLVDKRVSARRRTEGGDRGTGGGDAAGGGTAECKGGMEKAQGIVHGCGQPGTAARSSYAQADHGGSGQPL